ncbi:hypothetical protein KZZ52_24980 [Dactylosporangium sp. AC04546]|uniref:hypothetical protein n=1 Tax=Dactylosporangium sp. AC04546 TaxID=2862460 RepID=UPI001EDE6871|nr:hypothetical protein [Dactylosporangium sp. AC04546]WVK88525.1 hypothetical protein KZZ52_24980 [Dactylosporangium sp. AC04546]
MMRYFAVCLGHVSEGQAERWIRGFGVPAGAEVCTFREPGADAHVAVTFAVPGGTALELPPIRPECAGVAARAAAGHAAGRCGRAVCFRGSGALSGTMTAGAVVASTAIDRVAVLGAGAVPPGGLVGPLDGARPVWRDGRLTLLVVPAGGDTFAPHDEAAIRS